MCHKKDTLRDFVIPMFQINRTEPLLGPVKIPKLAADSERQIVLDKEDKSLQKHRQCRHPLSSSIETPFPCLYNCTVGSWQLYRQTATAKYSRQSSCTDREKSSQLLTTSGGGGILYMLLNSIRIYCIFFGVRGQKPEVKSGRW